MIMKMMMMPRTGYYECDDNHIDDYDDGDDDDDDDDATPDRSVPVTASLNIHACPRSKLFPTKSSSSQSSARSLSPLLL